MNTKTGHFLGIALIVGVLLVTARAVRATDGGASPSSSFTQATNCTVTSIENGPYVPAMTRNLSMKIDFLCDGGPLEIFDAEQPNTLWGAQLLASLNQGKVIKVVTVLPFTDMLQTCAYVGTTCPPNLSYWGLSDGQSITSNSLLGWKL